MRSISDQTAAARIRDAAIAEFAANGVAATSVRTIAATAGVSAGLVIHHFGSKERLRTTCDEYVAAYIRELKGDALSAGPGFDLAAALRSQSTGPPFARYLARTLVDGSPQVTELVDELVSDAVAYVQTGVETGMVKPSAYPKERAAILTVWTLGALVLHEHLERLIGVDITADFSRNPKAVSAYMAPILEIYSQGFLTEAIVDVMTDAFVDPPQPSQKPTSIQEKETA